MIAHIKSKSGTSTRAETAKVEKLFETMLLSYKMKHVNIMFFKQGQKLALRMIRFFKNQQDDVPAKCMEVLLSTSQIHLSLIGIVDGLNMDKLFISEQAIPPSTTTAKTVTAGNHLATIANTISTAVSGAGLTSKATANNANANQEETIDFKDMPANLFARYALKKHLVDIICKSDLAL